MEKCIGGAVRGRVPGRCIYVRGLDNPPTTRSRPGSATLRLRDQLPALYPLRPVCRGCPTEAITESKLFEFSFTNRSDAIYTKRELVVDDEPTQKMPWRTGARATTS